MQLPAYVTFDGEEPFFAIIEHYFRNGICFHRCISEKQAGDFYESWMNFEFPPLEMSKFAGAVVEIKSEKAAEITFDPALEIFTIKGNGMTLQLMKVAD